MKRTRKSQPSRAAARGAPSSRPASPAAPATGPLLAFGAHPDDIEFGCGGVVAKETAAGRPAHFVICSRGESATHGSPAERVSEAKAAAAHLGATVEFVDLDGDAHLEVSARHAITLAGLLRKIRPAVVLAPTLVENQHPDHAKLGRLVRDACRIARYGGVAELRGQAAHTVEHVLYYALSANAEPRDSLPIYIDISAPELVTRWTSAMEAHASQAQTRNYAEFQLARARLHGLNAGVGYAVPLWANDPLVFASLTSLDRAAKRF